MKIRFWGARGSFVAAGGEYVRYGGNTACVEITEGDRRIIMDLGSGAIPLGAALLAQGAERKKLNVLLSHTHMDHIQGFPFFGPIFHPKAQIDLYGPRGAGRRIDHVLDESLNPDYSPLYSLKNLSAAITFHNLGEEPFTIQDFEVAAAPLPHGRIESWAFRVTSGHGSVAYLTDVGYPGGVPVSAAVELCRGADLVIHDATFGPEEWREHEKWGHASWEHGLAVAEQAGAAKLALFHHAPDRTDDEVDRFVALAREAAPKGMAVVGAAEGEGGVLEI
jgi:phosphoribosyl 1,2-cyclic phosphodiesterase